MKCACGNAARYIDETGAMVCGICPIKAKLDAIRIADVPAVLGWLRDVVRARRDGRMAIDLLTFEDVDAISSVIGKNIREQ